MGPETFAYPFLFVAIFFETFVLLTFLSAPAKKARARGPSKRTPTVAIIVPCLNEAATVGATVGSLLALQYPAEKLSIILVDNGSTDETPKVMAGFKDHPQITVLHEAHRGKHNAINTGMAGTEASIIGCLDADSFVEPDALREMVTCFEHPEVAAATAAMSVHEPKNLLERMQYAEYSFGIMLRHTLSSINGLYVTPGPFSLYRREIVQKLGGFRFGYQTEDMEMALRLQQSGYRIDNAPHARVATKAPRTLRTLLKQRTRWISGFLYNITREYRGLLINSRHGALGMIVLPTAVFSIASGIITFITAGIIFGMWMLEGIFLRSGMPISYAYTPQFPELDFFYFPASAYLALACIMILGAFTMIVIGKRISKTPGALTPGLISYTLLYGLIAPLWLMRASADVLIGRKRSWR